MKYKYKTVRLVCRGEIKCCEFCKETDFNEGFCTVCGRPLWKKSGDTCSNIIGYLEKPSDGIFKKQGKIHIKCTLCKTMSTI